MVGLAAVAEFTHGIEAVLERIRSGSLGVDSDIITTLLEARDHLAMMVEAEAVKIADSAFGRADPAVGDALAGPGFGRGQQAWTTLEPIKGGRPRALRPSRSRFATSARRQRAPEAKPKRKRAPRKTKKMAAASEPALPVELHPATGRR